LVIKAIVLDSGPLGRLVHPRLNVEISDWLDEALASDITVYIPEIVDYEVRRGLLAADMTRSVRRLDEFKQVLFFLPLNTAAMLQAAEFWALARRQGNVVADPKELDGDVILAAQARQIGACVITENVGHLSLFVDAKDWREESIA
jgi:predicted nucleic acid-binding protein